ncbi:MAG TPA: hypothetical protein VHD56_19615 [Tepidisphaeraceae bacterium]|nr:hypothetical protein [Tepidisphaeraceae bacterium]
MKKMDCGKLAFMLIALLMNGGALAMGEVQLPLQGWYRAGRCMPVRVQTVSGPMRLQASGAVPIEASAEFAGIVPMQILADSAGPLTGTSAELPLHSLGADQRLVALLGQANAPPDDLFPNQALIMLRLESSGPLAGSAIAWETLDALVCDSPIDETHLLDLLAHGITIVMQSQAKPAGTLPWQAFHDGWILRPALAGPAGGLAGEQAYLPALSWHPTMKPALRRRIALAGVAICLLMLASLLIRSKWSLVAMFAVTLLGIVLIQIWRTAQPTFDSAGGAILVHAAGSIQHDQWLYLRAKSGGSAQTIRTGRPILIDPAQAAQIDLKIHCDSSGWQWVCTLPPGRMLAILSRSLETARPINGITTGGESPLYELARQSYLSRASSIAGERAPAPGSTWPDVVVKCDEPTP